MSDVKLELTDDMRAEMRRRAEAATPGPWYRTGMPWFLAEDAVLAGSPDGNVGFVIADCDCFSSRDEYEGDIQLSRPEDDAAYIVAACPANVIALLDECNRLKRERDEARAALKPFAKEEAAWSQSVADGYRPGILEPNQKVAHAKAEFSIGDLRRAARLLASYSEDGGTKEGAA